MAPSPPPFDFGSASSLLLAVAHPSTTNDGPAASDHHAPNSLPQRPLRRPRRTPRYLLTADEWTLVEQILLRGPAAWNTFLSLSSTASTTAAAATTPTPTASTTTTTTIATAGDRSPAKNRSPTKSHHSPTHSSHEKSRSAVLTVAEFYRLLQQPPYTAPSPSSLSPSRNAPPSPTPVTATAFPTPFVVACSLRVRIVLLELYYYFAAPFQAGVSTTTSTADGEDVARATTASQEDHFLDDIYYTLEDDLSCYQAWKSLQSDLNIDASHMDEKLAWNDDAIPGIGKLKYLIQKIEIQAKRLNGKVSIPRIQELLKEINPKPVASSKWANDDRIGQAELYEHLERVLEDLKNFKEHSFPFLVRVNKREAPDYFDIIKNPMDLATMSKKLKMLQYNNKKEFADDLQLIWDNCLFYNSDPASIYRTHAATMQERAAFLLKDVPNITVKTKAELEEEGYDSDQIAYAEMGDEEESSHAMEASASVTDPRSQSPAQVSPDKRVSTPVTELEEIIPEPVIASVPTAIIEKPTTLFPSSIADGAGQAFPPTDKDSVQSDNDSGVICDPLNRVWELRGEWISRRMLPANLPFAEQEGLVRTSAEMEEFAFLQDLYLRRRSIIRETSMKRVQLPVPQEPASSLSGDAASKEEEDSGAPNPALEPTEDDLYFLPEVNHLTSSLPELYDAVFEKRRQLRQMEYLHVPKQKRNHSDLHQQSPSSSSSFYSSVPGDRNLFFHRQLAENFQNSQPSLQCYPKALMPERGVQPVKANIETYRECKRLERKLLEMIQQTIRPLPPVTPQIMDDEPDREIRVRYPMLMDRPTTDPLPPLVMKESNTINLLKRSIALLLTQAGFEGTSSHAVQVFAEVVVHYLENMGRVYRSYCDSFSMTMPLEEILTHVLFESGIENARALDYSFAREPEILSQKLLSRRRKLQDYYDAIMLPSDDDENEEDADIDEDVAFLMGDFGENLGDDYLGFKSLGVGVVGPVPDKLWNMEGRKSKIRKQKQKSKILRGIGSSYLQEEDTAYQRFPPPDPFPPVEVASSQLGLLQEFFEKKLAEAPNGALVDDEFLPSKMLKKKKKKVSPRKEKAPKLKNLGSPKKRNRKKMDTMDM